jgi:hypothetical protein
MTEPTHDPAQDYEVEVTENPHCDEQDVAVALESETDDGKGGAVVPKADFVSYEDSDADQEETS